MFTDGLVRELDFAGKLPGVFAMIDDDAVFADATIDPVVGTVRWSVDVGLDPGVLQGRMQSLYNDGPILYNESGGA